MSNIYRDPREGMPVGAMSIYETEIDWTPRGEPYSHMVLRIHRENQRLINKAERAGYFDPVCPWFDIDFEVELGFAYCHHENNPIRGYTWSCNAIQCPTGWLC